MIYPEYIKDNETVGVTACSAGIKNKEDEFDQSIINFNKHHLNIKETKNVRVLDAISSDAKTRWEELKSLILDDDVKIIHIAAGGDYLYEMLDYVDYNLIKKHPKWICGSSDPTSLLFTITTKLDIATIYTPCNMCGYHYSNLHTSLENYFKIIKGERITQEFFPKYELNSVKESKTYNLDTKNEWININGETNTKGLIIGGCIESLEHVIGTKYDYVKKFLKRHQDQNIIWYFDVFSSSPEDLSMTLRQFNNAGWFKNTTAILIGKVKFPPTYGVLSYEEAIKRAITNIPIVYQFDIGHVKTSFTIINGSTVEVVSFEDKKYLKML